MAGGCGVRVAVMWGRDGSAPGSTGRAWAIKESLRKEAKAKNIEIE